MIIALINSKRKYKNNTNWWKYGRWRHSCLLRFLLYLRLYWTEFGMRPHFGKLSQNTTTIDFVVFTIFQNGGNKLVSFQPNLLIKIVRNKIFQIGANFQNGSNFQIGDQFFSSCCISINFRPIKSCKWFLETFWHLFSFKTWVCHLRSAVSPPVCVVLKFPFAVC
jgi:hypothetical protein